MQWPKFIHVLAILLLLDVVYRPAVAQEKSVQERDPKVTPLDLDSIFGQRVFRPKAFTGHWQKDGRGLEALRHDESGSRIVRLNVEQPTEETVLVAPEWLVPPGASKPLHIDGYEWSPDQTKVLIFSNSQKVWRYATRGDYWVLDLASKQLRKIAPKLPEASLMFAKFTPDGKKVGFVSDRNIYLHSLVDDQVKAVTTTTNDLTINGTFDWVYEEEFGLRDGFQFNQDGSQIAYWQIDPSGIGEFPLLNQVTSLYPRPKYIPYPKVGTTNPSARIGITSLSSNETWWVELPGDPREHYVHAMEWAPGRSQVLIQQLDRRQKINRFWLADTQSQGVRKIFEETDEAWLDAEPKVLWCDSNQRFLTLSEKSGWRRIVSIGIDGSGAQDVTTGEFDVIELLGYDPKKSHVYFIASPENATQKYLYRCQIDGTKSTRLTPIDQPGIHTYKLSPNFEFAIATHSQFTQPPTTRLIKLDSHSTTFVLEDNQAIKTRLNSLTLPKTEFFRLPIDESNWFDAWCITPADLDPSKKYPLIVYVYGEPAAQSVLDQWNGERDMWHRMLAQMGYIVVSIDNRGTPAPKGRAWRKSIYRQVGVLASADQASALREFMKLKPFVDSERVGVWGWSGGGSMTLNAMFRYPDLYRSGVSVAPVPNQLYYDTIYQERYMDLPSENADGYKQGSPITFAGQLKGDLLLIHGTGDDNCHYQTTELLIDELIRFDKKFSMFAYPNRSHSISEGTNTTKHLYGLITDQFLRTMPPNNSRR
jgi:dipeptidyl-peptidase-4